jgi:hypothetical protein
LHNFFSYPLAFLTRSYTSHYLNIALKPKQEKGALPEYVQHHLGHKNIQVTMQIYQHLTKKMSEEGAHLLDTI